MLIVCYRTKPLNEGENVVGIVYVGVFFLLLLFLLLVEWSENRRKRMQGKLSYGSCLLLTFYSKWQGNISRLLFFLSFFFSLCFFLCIYSSRASSYWQSMSTRFPAHKHTQSSRKRRKKRRDGAEKYGREKPCRLRRRRSSIISNFSCQFSLCATKENKRKNEAVDRWMNGKMHRQRKPLPPT